MKSKTFLWLVIGGNIAIALIFIHRQTLFVKQLYQKQRLEQQKNALLEKQDHLTKKLFILKNPGTVATQVREKLAMSTVNIKQIKTVAAQ